jgi:hypothetical protein
MQKNLSNGPKLAPTTETDGRAANVRHEVLAMADYLSRQ